MSKQRLSLETVAADEVVSSPGNVRKLVPKKPPARMARRTRVDKPHISLYIDPRVVKVIKRIALDYDLRAHDLYIHGVNLMLREFGQPTVEQIAPPEGK
jgi:hypothetical protein